MNREVEITEILKLIPHRYPLLLVDRVVELKLGEEITAIKNVTFNEPHFTGHFPDQPIMPGVLIVEAMAQVSALLVAKTINAKEGEKTVYFMGVENAKFRRPVEPGDTLYITAKIEQQRGDAWKFSAEAKVEDKVVAQSSFSAMVRDK